MKPKLADQAKGKWRDILAALGVSRDHLTGKHGPCPLCKDGKDRFRFDDKDGRGSWFCSQCGAGDGIEMVKRFLGLEFKEAAREIEKHLGSARAISVRHGRPLDEVRKEMNEIWKAGRPLDQLDATSMWWLRRLGDIPESTELRAVSALRCAGSDPLPGMVAMVRDAEGAPVNLHRTYLTHDGQKANIAEPRRVMDTTIPKGSAVRLLPHNGELGIAEGIETAMSCWRMFGVPTWAALNAENMKGFMPPEDVKTIVIYGEMDSSFTGQTAAFELARRCWAIRKKRDPELRVEVHIHGAVFDPSSYDRDWNDVLQATLKTSEAA